MKRLLPLGVLLLVWGLFASPVYAMTASPASGTLGTTATSTVYILAAPSGTSNAVSVRLTTSNITITNVSVPTTGYLSIGQCAGSANYTSTTVCYDLTKTGGNFTQGEIIGTITLRGNSAGSATISHSSGAGYVIGGSLSSSTGQIASYTVTTGGTVLPETGIFDNMSTTVILLIAGVLFLLALLEVHTKFLYESLQLEQIQKSISNQLKRGLLAEENPKTPIY